MPDEWPPRDLPPGDHPRDPREFRDDDRDPERGQHLVWIALAFVVCLVAWNW